MSKHREILLQNENYNNLKDNFILEGFRGSTVYNTAQNSQIKSDIDTFAIALMPIDYYIGLEKFKRSDFKVGEYDTVIYDVRNFINLCYENNINVIELLWLNDNFYFNKTEAGKLLLENRKLFSSKLVYKCIKGYALGQLKGMQYFQKTDLGSKRQSIIDKYGYDTKQAYHTIRLLNMGIEFLVTEELNVFRNDAFQLMEIKNGKWTLEQIKLEADRLFDKLETAFITSKLPNTPDKKKINNLLAELILNSLERTTKIQYHTENHNLVIDSIKYNWNKGN